MSSDGGVFIYHPLHAQTPLYELYAASAMGTRMLTHELSPADRAALMRRYGLHMRHVLARRAVHGHHLEPAGLTYDQRPLVARFRKFFPLLIEQTSLTDKASRVAVFFPKLEYFDNRCVEIKGHNEAIFITSRSLDVIELFARTLSMAVRLNGAELPAMLGGDDPPPAHVQLAWMTMCAPPLSDGYRLNRVLASGTLRRSDALLRAELYGTHPKQWLTAEQRGLGHRRLAASLTWFMLRAMSRLVRGLGGECYLGLTSALSSPSHTMLGLDAEYLSMLILSFIVLHEIGHFALGHNQALGATVDPVLRQITDAPVRHARAQGHIAHHSIGSCMGHETAADAFAIEVLDEEHREAMLEAATLWCAALAGTNDDCGDWLEDSGASAGARYPAFAMRVWYLNGRLSVGKRQGRIAQEITRQAEALAHAIQADDAPLADAELIRSLWHIAMHETGNRGQLLSRLMRCVGVGRL